MAEYCVLSVIKRQKPMAINIRYVGPARDYSGYGEANRHDIAALVSAGINTSVELTRHCLEISEFGELGKMVSELEGKRNNYEYKILHTTPNIYGQFIEPGKYHIGRVFWETDCLPPDFAAGAQLCDEIWTGSEFNKAAIIKAGVTKPIYIIPEAVVSTIEPDDFKPFIIEAENTYKFYSIFEWTERKNPLALLEAYYKEFQNGEPVSLTIKTYVDNFTPGKKSEVEQQVFEIKKKLNLEYYPPVYLCLELLNREQMYRFHRTYDCFVSAHRGEGWGIPQMEAMLMGKPIISTGCGGIHEYIENGVNGFTPNFEMIPIRNNTRNNQWYREDQNWAQVDVSTLRAYLRLMCENKEKSEEIGKAGRKLVQDRFDVHVVGQLMLERLNKIEAKRISG